MYRNRPKKSLLLISTLLCQLLFIESAKAGITNSDVKQIGRFRVTNQCPHSIWVQQDFKNSTNDPIVVKIDKGLSYDYAIPDKGLASTRFWAKSGCNADGYNCKIGESTGVPQAEDAGVQKGPYAPDINSKFEATWGCLKAIYNNNSALCAKNPSSPGNPLGTETWWNGSAVDGYTFPYAIKVKNHNNTCVDLHSEKVMTNPGVDCGKLTPNLCPTTANLSTEGAFNVINGVDVTRVNLQWLDTSTGQAVGCMSPCAKLTTAQGSDDGSTNGGWRTMLGELNPDSDEAKMYCCPTPPVSSGQCSAGPAARSAYAQSVHLSQLCNAYTYAYDDAKGLAKCDGGTQFEVVFCPQESTESNVVDMTVVIAEGTNAFLNNGTITDGQVVTLTTGSKLAFEVTNETIDCTLQVNEANRISGKNGALCDRLTIDNEAKVIRFPDSEDPKPTGFAIQFNLNPYVGIHAFLNSTALQNAMVLDSSVYGESATLKATQGSKQASCLLQFQNQTVTKGNGEFCNRLNIVKEATGKVHVYLPADIPHEQEVQAANIVTFGMDNSLYVTFDGQTYSNNSKAALSTLGENKTISLVAYQNEHSASCQITKNQSTLSIIDGSGNLCHQGLVLMVLADGNYYIGIPHPLPTNDDGGGVTKTYELGIASGMQVTVNGKTIQWNSADKKAKLMSGENTLSITGVNGQLRICPMQLNNDKLSWPSSADCVGVVNHGEVIYFPAF